MKRISSKSTQPTAAKLLVKLPAFSFIFFWRRWQPTFSYAATPCQFRAFPAIAFASLIALVTIGSSKSSDAAFTLYQCNREYIESEINNCADGINLAECQENKKFDYILTYSGTETEGLYIFIGAGCDNKENRDEGKCYGVLSGESIPTDNSVEFQIEPAWVVDPMSSTPTCQEGEGSNNLYVFVLASDADQTILDSYYQAVSFDTRRPQAPINVKADYGNENVRVSWEVSEENAKEWKYFRVLCYPAPGSVPAVDASTDATMESDIPMSEEAIEDLPPSDLESEGEVGEPSDAAIDWEEPREVATETSSNCPTGGFNQGDLPSDTWMCTEMLGSSTRSATIDGLQNGLAYKFAVVAYDEFRNPSLVSQVACATPQPVCDFWCQYKNSGGEGGGFCFIATSAYGSPLHPFVAVLRSFRDEILSLSPGGRWLIERYYLLSRPAAAAIYRSPPIKIAAQVALVPVVVLAWGIVNVWHHPWLLLALAGFVGAVIWVTRRKKIRQHLSWGMAIIVGLWFVQPLPAHARVEGEPTSEGRMALNKKREGSPQHFAAELKFGPYYPDVDEEFGGEDTPFADTFGSNAALHGLFELDYQFLHLPGISFAIGALIGGFKFNGKAINATTGERSGEETTLSVMTMHLDAVIRVDALLYYTAVPLVPYVKGGLSYYIWWTTNHSGISEIDGKEGIGGTFGWNLQTGLMLCLDSFEQRAARTFDNEIGVNNSYIFAEMLLARIDNFERKGTLHLSDTTWMIGIALEF